ncbi:MAG TPA: hypothetical protein VGC74_18285 [Stenotrophomonas sp.]|jgi:hypothetical protein
MKIQVQQQSMRVRVDEDELAQLLAEVALVNRTRLALDATWSLQLGLHDDEMAAFTPTPAMLQLWLPRRDVFALQARLPSRDGLVFEIDNEGGTIEVRFDVDVRDSVRRRDWSKVSAAAVSSH